MFAYLKYLSSSVAFKYVDWCGDNYGITAAGGLIAQAGLELDNTDGVSFLWWGATLKRLDAPTNFNYKPMTVTNCDGFSISGGSTDFNGSLYFGGMSFYDCNRLRIYKHRFYDGAPGAVTSDRYGLLVSTSTLGGSDDIEVDGCTFDGLQTEFLCTNARIVGNAFKNSVNRAIGIVSGGNSMVRGDITISANTFDNVLDDCVTLGSDPSSNTGTLINNITITGNSIRSTAASGGHFVSCSSIGATNKYSNISVVGNTMMDSAGNPFIKFDSSNNSAYTWDIDVSHNIYSSTAATVTGPVYNFRRVSNGQVCHNQCIGTGVVDAFKFDATGRLKITYNIAEATGNAYELTNTLNSTTGLQVFKDNCWRGTPTNKIYLPTGLNASDVVDPQESDFSDVTVTGANQAVSVAGMANIRITAGAAASVSTFTNGYYGKEITLYFDNGNVTINHGTSSSNPRLAGAVNFVGSQYDTLTLVYHTDGRWREKSRAVI